MWGNDETQFFYNLTPDQILQTIEEKGYSPTGRFFQLNSLENRVYEIEVAVDEEQLKNESERFLIAKFYRPGRWSKEQLQEEHDFMHELVSIELPVIAPLKLDDQSLFYSKDLSLYYCLYPKCSGRNPDEIPSNDWQQIGRLLGRMHGVGASKNFKHRLTLSPQQYLNINLESLLKSEHLPNEFKKTYEVLIASLFNLSEPIFSQIPNQRLHGDFHLGNVIKREDKYFMVDFDDSVTGPKVQDLWLLLPPEIDPEHENAKRSLLSGYSLMNSKTITDFHLISFLRIFRQFHFTAWISKRWDDPIFPKYFPQFATQRYFEEQINDLKLATASFSNY